MCPAVAAGGAAAGRCEAGSQLTLLLPVLESGRQCGQGAGKRVSHLAGSSLGFFCFKSVLRSSGSRGLSSLLFPKKQTPGLGTAPRLSLQGQVPPESHGDVRISLLSLSLPHPPTSPRAARLQMARACRGAGLVPEGREQCGPWAITPGLQHGLPVLTVQDRYPGSHVRQTSAALS